MSDLIDRTSLAEHKFPSNECNGLGEGPAYRQGWNDAIDAIIDNAPSAETETHEKRTKTHACDCISRQEAIDALQREIDKAKPPFDDTIGAIRCGVRLARNIIEDLPSAEPNSNDMSGTRKALDTISRRAAIDALEHLTDFVRYDSLENGETLLFQDSAIELINSLPSAEPRMKGKWIYGENDCQDGWFCSVCGEFIPWDYDYYGKDCDFIRDFKTCPYCDAKMVSYTGMRGEEDEVD